MIYHNIILLNFSLIEVCAILELTCQKTILDYSVLTIWFIGLFSRQLVRQMIAMNGTKSR